MQVCPVAANTPAISPLAAAVRSASGKTICGDLPPSSRVTRLRLSAAACATARPVAVDPVNATLSTPGCPASAAPVSRDSPVTTLNTPGGKPACSNRAAKASVDAGECSEGLTTNVQPAASAGATFQVISSSGEFHGVIAADHADRLPPRVHEVVRVGRGDLPALQLVGQPGVVQVPAAEPGRLADHLPVQLARVADLQAGQGRRVLGDQVGQAAQQRGPLEAGLRAPVAVQRGPGRGHGRVHVLRAAVGDQRPGAAGKRVLRFEGPAGDRVHSLAADHHLELGQLSGHGPSIARSQLLLRG